MLLSLGILSEEAHKRYVSYILKAVAPTEYWCGQASKRLRSTAEAATWLVEETVGALMQHIVDTMCKVEDSDSLLNVGLPSDRI